MSVFVDNIFDSNQNIIDDSNPRLIGYLPVEYFRVFDTDESSAPVRDILIPVEQFYDYNLENYNENLDDNNEVV